MIQRLSLLFIASLLIFSILSCDNDSPEPSKSIVKIGALLPLTGDVSTKGLNAKAGIEIAVEEINLWLGGQGINKSIEVVIKDTESDPTFALANCKLLREDSIDIVIGPMISNCLDAIRDYCMENEMVIISPSSTNPDLSIANDGIYRLAPDDNQQASALAKTMYDNGIRRQITFMRLGEWEVSLNNMLKSAFETLGGESEEMIPYNPKADQNFTDDIQMLESTVSTLLATTPSTQFGIQMIGFDEGVEILEQCSEIETFSGISWYACDGLTLSSRLLNNLSAVEFAVEQELSAPLFSEPQSDKYAQIKLAIEQRTQSEASIYAVNAYDASWLASLSLLELGLYSPGSFDTQLQSVITTYEAASGSIEFNEYGDRTNVSYDIWQVQLVDGDYQWVKTNTIAAD